MVVVAGMVVAGMVVAGMVVAVMVMLGLQLVRKLEKGLNTLPVLGPPCTLVPETIKFETIKLEPYKS